MVFGFGVFFRYFFWHGLGETGAGFVGDGEGDGDVVVDCGGKGVTVDGGDVGGDGDDGGGNEEDYVGDDTVVSSPSRGTPIIVLNPFISNSNL